MPVDIAVLAMRRGGSTLLADLLDGPYKMHYEPTPHFASGLGDKSGVKWVKNHVTNVKMTSPKKIIILTRDIRDVTLSLKEYMASRGNDLDRYLDQLVTESESLVKAAKTFPHFHVRYEDLCTVGPEIIERELGIKVNEKRTLLPRIISGWDHQRVDELMKYPGGVSPDSVNRYKHEKSPLINVMRLRCRGYQQYFNYES